MNSRALIKNNGTKTGVSKTLICCHKLMNGSPFSYRARECERRRASNSEALCPYAAGGCVTSGNRGAVSRSQPQGGHSTSRCGSVSGSTLFVFSPGAIA